MTDLSKQLALIKRRHRHDETAAGVPMSQYEANIHHDRARLLHIIEVEIPGMLRAKADAMDIAESMCSPVDNLTHSILNMVRDELHSQATRIESLTNEKEKG